MSDADRSCAALLGTREHHAGGCERVGPDLRPPHADSCAQCAATRCVQSILLRKSCSPISAHTRRLILMEPSCQQTAARRSQPRPSLSSPLSSSPSLSSSLYYAAQYQPIVSSYAVSVPSCLVSSYVVSLPTCLVSAYAVSAPAYGIILRRFGTDLGARQLFFDLSSDARVLASTFPLLPALHQVPPATCPTAHFARDSNAC
eukprot:2597322-Rhodomonas_salina.2